MKMDVVRKPQTKRDLFLYICPFRHVHLPVDQSTMMMRVIFSHKRVALTHVISVDTQVAWMAK